MAYNKIHQWDKWLSCFPGQCVLSAEWLVFKKLLTTYYGHQTVVVGSPAQQCFLESQVMTYGTLLSPLHKRTDDSPFFYVESDFNELPLATASIDTLILPHSLEMVRNPRPLLGDACRALKPEGHLVIFGFNPNSLWRIMNLFHKPDMPPWSHQSVYPSRLKKWLSLADFEIEQEFGVMYRPPMANQLWFDRMHFIEKIGRFCHMPGACIYVIVARARHINMTPIKLNWKEALYTLGVPAIDKLKPSARNQA